MLHDEQLYDHARRIISGADRIAVLTGAGISAESGIPTYRGEGGLWKTYQAEDLATLDAFHRQPELVWEWYNERRGQMRQVEPNPGHFALAELERRSSGHFMLMTQNIDRLHQRAGSQSILELHGQAFLTNCIACDYCADDFEAPERGDMHCPQCDGGLVRPSVIWFGEMLDPEVIDAAEQACRECGVLLVVGSSLVVYPVAALPLTALRHGAKVIQVNVEPTEMTGRFDVFLQGLAGEVLPRIVEG